MFCVKCGNKLDEDVLFCKRCNSKQPITKNECVKRDEHELERTVGIFDTIPTQPPNADPLLSSVTQNSKNTIPVQNTEYDIDRTVSIFDTIPTVQETQSFQPEKNNIKNPVYSNNGKVSFFKAIALSFKNCFKFNGRASKSEYWWVFLFNAILLLPLCAITAVIPVLGIILAIALFIPRISLEVRRLHDVGKSGTYWLIGLIPIAGFILLIIQFIKNSDDNNKWGPRPN